MKLLEREAFKCRANETNVPHEMRDVIKNIPNSNQKTAVDGLLRFLSDKYDTKQWIVMVSKGNQEINDISFEGFHKVVESDLVVAAISVDRSTASEFDELYLQYTKDSKSSKDHIDEDEVADRGSDISVKHVPQCVKTLQEMANQFDKNFLFILISCKYFNENSPEFTVIATWTEAEQVLFTGCAREAKKQMKIIQPISSQHARTAKPVTNKNYFVYIASDSPPNAQGSLLRNQSYLHTGKDQRLANQEIEEEMSKIIVQPNNDRMGVADAIVNFLEDKYGDRKWLVIVISKDKSQSIEKLERFLYGQSKFYTVSSKGLLAAAVSIQNPEDTLKKFADIFRINIFLVMDSCNTSKNDKIQDVNIVATSTGEETVLFTSDFNCVDQVKSQVLQDIKYSLNVPFINDHPDFLFQRGVKDEMRQVITNLPVDKRNIGVAHTILNTLEDKYDDKKWLVLVISEKEAQSKGTMERVLSGGFHTVSVEGLFAAAVAIDRDAIDPITRKKFQHRAHNYHFPIKTIDKMKDRPDLGFNWKYLESAEDVYQNFNRYLSPMWMWTNELMEIETVAITTSCGNHRRIDILDYMTTAASRDGFTWAVHFENDDCSDRLVVAVLVPTATRHLSPHKILTKCYFRELLGAGLSRVLRNEFSQAYLSVQDNLDNRGANRIIDNKWMDSIGQKWQFVSFFLYGRYQVTQLRNGNNKCLTAYKRQSQELYQEDCYLGYSPGQTWEWRGLQIVNGFELCLTLEESIANSSIVHDIQARCESTPPFFWYNWAADCENLIVNHPSMKKSNRYLRNYFSKRFLSAAKERAKHEPWTNQPGQNWKFIDEKLVNGDSKCLAIKGNFVGQEDCVKNRKEQKWSINLKTKQVIGADGKCLSVGEKSGYVTYNTCTSNNAKQQWNH